MSRALEGQDSIPVFVANVHGQLAPWEHDFVPKAQAWLMSENSRPFTLARRPEDADLIVFFESNSFKTQRYISVLQAEPAIAQFPARCFTINYETGPAGFLPGLYTSLPASKYDPLRHRTWSYVFRGNEDIAAKRVCWTRSPRLLFSFRGSVKSHPIREELLNISFPRSSRSRLTAVDRWFDHTADERNAFIDELLDSCFCLCPRGLGVGTIRLFEVMAAGRCPVIISDEWVPNPLIDWSACSIRVKQADLKLLPDILSDREKDSVVLGRNALCEWEKHFSSKVVLRESFSQIVSLLKSRPEDHDESRARSMWNTRKFYRQNGWAIEQRIARRLKRAFKKVFSR